MILKLDMKHQGEALYKVYINDPDLDLFYGKVNIDGLCICMGKNVKMSLEEKNLKKMGKWTEEL